MVGKDKIDAIRAMMHTGVGAFAHEVRHLFGTTARDQVDDTLSSDRAGATAANQFAAELLIPLKHLKADFRGGVRSIKHLSERYRVSEEALGWKIVHSSVLSLM